MARILLADADAFFVGVARLADPEGAGRAPLLIVGGSRDSRGVVCSASYETRKFGVRSAMPIARALRLCPNAMCVPVPFKACLAKSAEIRDLLQKFAPVVETASVDEWYMDLTGTERLYHHESLHTTAQRIREAVHQATGLTVSIGGGTNKLIAKLAVDRAKPSANGAGVHIVDAAAEEAFLRSCALADIPLVGPKFQARLAARGLVTVEDVLRLNEDALRQWLSDREARWLWNRVHGIDNGRVHQRESARGLSRDETFSKDLHDDRDIEHELLRLVTRAAADLRSEGLAARPCSARRRASVRSAQVVEGGSTDVVHDAGRIRRDGARPSLVESDQWSPGEVRTEEHPAGASDPLGTTQHVDPLAGPRRRRPLVERRTCGLLSPERAVRASSSIVFFFPIAALIAACNGDSLLKAPQEPQPPPSTLQPSVRLVVIDSTQLPFAGTP